MITLQSLSKNLQRSVAYYWFANFEFYPSHFTNSIYSSAFQAFICVKCWWKHFTNLHAFNFKPDFYCLWCVKCCEVSVATLHTHYHQSIIKLGVFCEVWRLKQRAKPLVSVSKAVYVDDITDCFYAQPQIFSNTKNILAN